MKPKIDCSHLRQSLHDRQLCSEEIERVIKLAESTEKQRRDLLARANLENDADSQALGMALTKSQLASAKLAQLRAHLPEIEQQIGRAYNSVLEDLDAAICRQADEATAKVVSILTPLVYEEGQRNLIASNSIPVTELRLLRPNLPRISEDICVEDILDASEQLLAYVDKFHAFCPAKISG